jgi:outer membrane protein assembly factor BamB
MRHPRWTPQTMMHTDPCSPARKSRDDRARDRKTVPPLPRRATILGGLLPLLLLLNASEISAAHEWPEFRGPTGQGHAAGKNLPLEWSATKNVVWKQSVPGSGWSSPVIAGGRIFLTTGVTTSDQKAALHALALDGASGRILWDTVIVPDAGITPDTIHQKNSPASPTPIVEGDRVFVHFGHHGTACLDRDGRILWRTSELAYDPLHGNGSSPILAEDKLVFTADGTSDPFVAALDKKTGKVAWKFMRTVQPRQTFSFCTPLLITIDGQAQIIAPGAGAVSALNPHDGRELWHVRYGSGYSVVPRPVAGHGLLFIATGFNRADLLAVRMGGATGDVTDTHVAWRTTKGAPLTPSLVLVGDELYGVNDAGLASCWDAKTGMVHWQEKIDGNYSASPLAAEGRIYFQNETGTGTVLAAQKTFTKLATNKLEERTLASYAVAENAFFIRTEKHLYRIQQK